MKGRITLVIPNAREESVEKYVTFTTHVRNLIKEPAKIEQILHFVQYDSNIQHDKNEKRSSLFNH